ncbi:MAG TPA: PsbP-related protein [Lacibacter sp.]|nr:PsbP-related protein [Lacibacter sp.]HMO88157.1 PsbP-related protein [Lacibacter sp.]HMP88055.1 PsbP-related protein [Lacibacter sp.]
MKQLIVLLLLVTAAAPAWAQPARVPVNDPPPSNTNTKPTTQPVTTPTTVNTNVELTKYSDPQGRFTIGYPGNWTFNDKAESAVLQITSPKENDADEFRQNLNLQIEDMSGKSTTVDQYVKTNMDAVKGLIKGYSEVSSMFFNRNGSRAYEVVYKGKYGEMTYDIKIRQLFTIVNSKAYILTYVSKADERDAFETTANRIFNSFKY